MGLMLTMPTRDIRRELGMLLCGPSGVDRRILGAVMVMFLAWVMWLRML